MSTSGFARTPEPPYYAVVFSSLHISATTAMAKRQQECLSLLHSNLGFLVLKACVALSRVAPHLTVMDYERAEHGPWSLGSFSAVLL